MFQRNYHEGPREPFGSETEYLPAIQVKNTVEYVNPAVQAPFDLEEGKPADLGLFVVNETNDQSIPVGVDEFHGRSALLGRMVFSDNEGNIYRDVDLKGLGFLASIVGDENESVVAGKMSIVIDDEHFAWGIWNESRALRERDILEDLIKVGVRTNRILSIIKLEEIALPDGKKISIKEARRRKMVPKNEDPVVGVRGYRIRDRVGSKNDRSKEFFVSCKKNIENELGRELGWEEYAAWFAETLGVNFAKIHNAGYWHGYPLAHNITMACEIIDFGFGEGSKKIEDLDPKLQQEMLAKDFVNARSTLWVLMNELSDNNFIPAGVKDNILEVYNDAYRKTINPEYMTMIDEYIAKISH